MLGQAHALFLETIRTILQHCVLSSVSQCMVQQTSENFTLMCVPLLSLSVTHSLECSVSDQLIQHYIFSYFLTSCVWENMFLTQPPWQEKASLFYIIFTPYCDKNCSHQGVFYDRRYSSPKQLTPRVYFGFQVQFIHLNWLCINLTLFFMRSDIIIQRLV